MDLQLTSSFNFKFNLAHVLAHISAVGGVFGELTHNRLHIHPIVLGHALQFAPLIVPS